MAEMVTINVKLFATLKKYLPPGSEEGISMTLPVGATVADAFLAMYALETTCQIQLAAQSSGAKLIPVEPEIIDGVGHAIEAVGLGGSLVWPALIRKLDRIDPSYKQ